MFSHTLNLMLNLAILALIANAAPLEARQESLEIVPGIERHYLCPLRMQSLQARAATNSPAMRTPKTSIPAVGKTVSRISTNNAVVPSTVYGAPVLPMDSTVAASKISAPSLLQNSKMFQRFLASSAHICVQQTILIASLVIVRVVM